MSGDFKPTSNGWGVQPIGPSPYGSGGDIHDTFKVDSNGVVTGGHATIQLPGGQTVRMPWNGGK